MFGCRAIIFLPANTSPARVKAIRTQGAEVVEVDCLFESALAGSERPSRGSLESSMDGLACRAPSSLAWKIIETETAAFEPTLSEPLGLGENSKVIVFGSEGPA